LLFKRTREKNIYCVIELVTSRGFCLTHVVIKRHLSSAFAGNWGVPWWFSFTNGM